jgi:hypothetical protein
MHFNVFEAAPENERDGPSHQVAQNAGGKVSALVLSSLYSAGHELCFAVARILPIDYLRPHTQGQHLCINT